MGDTEAYDNDYWDTMEEYHRQWNTMSKKLQWYLESGLQNDTIEGYQLTNV